MVCHAITNTKFKILKNLMKKEFEYMYPAWMDNIFFSRHGLLNENITARLGVVP